MSTSIIALIAFVAWQLLLTVLLATYRTSLVMSGQKQANAFKIDGSDVSAFGQRLTRARDNCHENLPAFAALVLGASLAGQSAVTDPLAMSVLIARIGQSVTHVVSTSVRAVQIRFGFYSIQLAIMVWWAILLLRG